MNALLISQTTNAIATNVISALRNWPRADRDLCRRIAACGRLQHDLQLREVDAAEGESDRRHDDVLDEGDDDRPERGADDDTDGQRQSVGLDKESAEIGQHGHLLERSREGR